jgi:hypothetical protein
MDTSGSTQDHDDPTRRWMDALHESGGAGAAAFLQPHLIEAAGTALAAALASSDIDTVLTWDRPGDVVLGHVLARELGAIRVELYEAQGTVELSQPLLPGSRCVLAARAFDEVNHARGGLGAISSYGGRLLAVACVVGTQVLSDEAADGITIIELPGL